MDTMMTHTDEWIDRMADRLGDGILGAMLGFLAVMLTALLALAISMLPTSARADVLEGGLLPTTCGPERPALPVPPKALPPPAHMPAQIKGQGTAALISANSSGVAAGWWVAEPSLVRLYLYAATWEYLWSNPDVVARLIALAVIPGGDANMALAVGAAMTPTLDIRDMCDIWQPIAAGLNASKPLPLNQQPPPPAPSYESTGTLIYPMTPAGTRSITALPQRIAARTPCDCTPPPATIPILELNGLVRYCKVAPPAGVTGPVVTACKKTP